jgi:type I restriction enzyme R subunit
MGSSPFLGHRYREPETRCGLLLVRRPQTAPCASSKPAAAHSVPINTKIVDRPCVGARDALVDQALTDGFKAHLPNEPCDRIFTYNVDRTKRLFVATEQTLSLCYTKFSPSFFDLIVFDEAHRSLFSAGSRRSSNILTPGMVGLTATPARFVDRDTFRVFHCDGLTATFLYDFTAGLH